MVPRVAQGVAEADACPVLQVERPGDRFRHVVKVEHGPLPHAQRVRGALRVVRRRLARPVALLHVDRDGRVARRELHPREADHVAAHLRDRVPVERERAAPEVPAADGRAQRRAVAAEDDVARERTVAEGVVLASPAAVHDCALPVRPRARDDDRARAEADLLVAEVGRCDVERRARFDGQRALGVRIDRAFRAEAQGPLPDDDVAREAGAPLRHRERARTHLLERARARERHGERAVGGVGDRKRTRVHGEPRHALQTARERRAPRAVLRERRRAAARDGRFDRERPLLHGEVQYPVQRGERARARHGERAARRAHAERPHAERLPRRKRERREGVHVEDVAEGRHVGGGKGVCGCAVRHHRAEPPERRRVGGDRLAARPKARPRRRRERDDIRDGHADAVRGDEAVGNRLGGVVGVRERDGRRLRRQRLHARPGALRRVGAFQVVAVDVGRGRPGEGEVERALEMFARQRERGRRGRAEEREARKVRVVRLRREGDGNPARRIRLHVRILLAEGLVGAARLLEDVDVLLKRHPVRGDVPDAAADAARTV